MASRCLQAGRSVVLEGGGWATRAPASQRAQLASGAFAGSWVSVQDGNGLDLIRREQPSARLPFCYTLLSLQ